MVFGVYKEQLSAIGAILEEGDISLAGIIQVIAAGRGLNLFDLVVAGSDIRIFIGRVSPLQVYIARSRTLGTAVARNAVKADTLELENCATQAAAVGVHLYNDASRRTWFTRSSRISGITRITWRYQDILPGPYHISLCINPCVQVANHEGLVLTSSILLLTNKQIVLIDVGISGDANPLGLAFLNAPCWDTNLEVCGEAVVPEGSIILKVLLDILCVINSIEISCINDLSATYIDSLPSLLIRGKRPPMGTLSITDKGFGFIV